MLPDAQATMRGNYINGGPGVVVSGLIWLIAAVVTGFAGFTYGMIAFFIGGMLIVPVSGFIDKSMKTEVVPPDKSLTRLALLTLPLLFGGLFLAYILGTKNRELFYPVMAIAIGLRYLIFQRVYGLNAFFMLGGVLILVGIAGYFASPELIYVPIAVGIIELVMGLGLIRKFRQ